MRLSECKGGSEVEIDDHRACSHITHPPNLVSKGVNRFMSGCTCEDGGVR